MPLTKAQVEHVARLARLNLTAEEIERFTQELAVILEYVDQLQTVNTDGVEPQNQFIAAENVFREDLVVPSLPIEKVLGNAPVHDGEFFLVPKVIGG
ncbi:MAG: Asp-tRNA(Asn)/Glu-tRNA(Gln) amidotransferase subunit GatC [candidate division Zixibacteria bacterium]|nr:Asp-tRNA(Asn)/Glu-tRNA(Gln) amidotransferase subunit GatC [candidate division Zixibacteria bacterium]